MDIFKGTFPGLLILLGLFCSADAQTCTTIANCSRCTGTTCLTCNDGYSQNEANTGCCSKGCPTDEKSYHLCNVNTALCSYEGCQPGYYGPYCLPCTSKIQNCDHCGVVQGTTDTVECITCATTFFKTTDNQHCCPMGCDSCTGPSGTTCTTCKASYFLYNQKCDTCGNNCVEPTDGSARCDPVTGRCILGCEDGWHGSKCDVQCTLPRCDRCTYDEPTTSLTCADCNSGYYGPSCVACSATCASKANGDLCNHEGTCSNDCLPGYRGNKCDMTCDSAVDLQNCLECDRYSFSCTRCKAGYWGPQCQNNCNANCVEFLGERSCTINNGSCDRGCLATHYKMDCSGSCPNCGNDVCERETGVCLDPICDAGFWGRNCNNSCPAHCRPQTFQGVATCNFQNGNCTTGCTDGNWGEFCNEGCSVNCALSPQATETGPLCTQSDGTCVHRCKAGSYRLDCSETCQSECVTGACDITDGICVECRAENPGYLCPEGTCSPVNTWGVFCEYTCPVNCADGTCSREDGTCSSCKAGKHGDRCDQDCPNCATNACDQDSGICLDSCKDGWYQLDCMSKCKHEGCQTCERNDGECVTCKAGTYGQNCSMVCARTCALGTNGQITCNRFTGQCDMNACRSGYYTPTCTEECSAFCQSGSCDLEAGTCSPCINGWYGQKCDGECSTRCKNKDCETTEASCRQGCTDGYWGSSCEKVCNVNCAGKACNKETAQCLYGCNGSNFYGLTCLEPCNVNCIDKVCNRTGYCQRECVTGWYGDKCQYQCTEVSKCTDGKCSRLGGICEDCLEENPGSNCPSAECPSGKRGQQCEDDCTSSNCLYNQCGRYTDKCNGCPSGLYGDKCELTCSNCRTGTGCDQATGECNVGCKDGWFEPDCETKCDTKCGSCDRLTGECITCAVASWGPDCGRLCSSNCVETHVSGNHFVLCDKNTGHCEEQACKVGHWREDCTQNCSINCLPDENNNRVCAYLNGECARGCKKTFFGRTCGFLCSTRCRDQLCTNFADTCDLGCTDGYYGATCASVCSSHCAGDGGCNPSTGACYDGCEKGYYGTRCIDPCKNTCVDGFCDATEGGCADCRIDPVGPNCRIQLCDPGLYGPTCESKCPGNYCLNNQCKRTSGDCNTGCLNGYYGAYCAGVCQCDAAGTEECEQTKGECICKVGRRGTLCDLTCSSGCVDLTCERDGTCSNGCISGLYGARCEDSCSNCMNQACNAANGVCLQGCIEGWYGTQCNMPCGSECKACDVQTGLCTSCANDFYSLPQCDRTCSSNCKIQGTGRQCNQATGDCMYGCVTGYYSLKCSESCGRCSQCDPADGSCPVCNAGWWGTTCKNQCSPYCARGGSSNERMCRQSDGFCEFGCDAGYYGDSCASQCIGQNCLNGGCHRQIGTCTSGCQPYFYDTNCDQRCNTCKNGLCNQVNGYCTEDCPANSYGNKCDKECLTPLCVDATCERYSGYCADCQTSPKGPNCAVQDPVTPAAQVAAEELAMESIIGITVGSVAFVIVFVVVFVCCMNYKRRYEDAKSEIHLPSEFIEPSHRSLQGTASTNYPVARVVDDSEKDFVLF